MFLLHTALVLCKSMARRREGDTSFVIAIQRCGVNELITLVCDGAASDADDL